MPPCRLPARCLENRLTLRDGRPFHLLAKSSGQGNPQHREVRTCAPNVLRFPRRKGVQGLHSLRPSRERCPKHKRPRPWAQVIRLQGLEVGRRVPSETGI